MCKPVAGLQNIFSVLFMITVFLLSCKKDDDQKKCPLQTYKVECDIRTWDLVFGGYNTGTNQYTIEANCPGDADKMAKEMSYDMGQVYKHCHIVP